jgi:small subunit ribosomal protein S16
MAVKIRLQRHGRKQNPYYKIVVADARSPRDGKFIERLGFYNPMTVPATIEIDREKALDWIQKGAQPSDTVRAILRFKGVLFHKHLLRGVAKGALTQEQADTRWQEFIAEKESKVEARRNKVSEEKKEFHKAVSGSAKVVPPVVVPPAPVEEAAPVADETVEAVTETPTTEEVVAAVETPVVAETPTIEESPIAEVPVEEAPAAETPVEEAPSEEAPAIEEENAPEE